MIRLQKFIAASGLASRRAAETMIRDGVVTVNGRVVRVLGTCVEPLTDHVKVNGRHVGRAEPEVFVLLHKPAGYVTTMRDPHGRPTVADLLAAVNVRVVPVGRLDYDAEGLLLLTNNGKVAQTCLHPRYHVPKTYLVKVSGVCADEDIRRLQDGVALDDGVTAPALVKKSGKARVNSWLEITIHEGKKHQVKRMIEAVGHRVGRIKRIGFGPLMLGALRVGTCRFATDAEANALRALLRQPMRARNIRPDVSSRVNVSTGPVRPKDTVSPAPARKFAPPAHTRKPAPPAHTRKFVPPAHTRKSAPPAHTRKSVPPVHTRKFVPPVHTRKPAPPAHTLKSAPPAHTRKFVPPAHTRKPAPPVHARKPTPPAHTRKPASPVYTRKPAPPAHTRKPASPVYTRKPAPPAHTRKPASPVYTRKPAPPAHTRKPAPPVHARKPAPSVHTRKSASPGRRNVGRGGYGPPGPTRHTGRAAKGRRVRARNTPR